MFFIVWNICICIVYLWFASEKYFDLTWTIPPKPLDALISKLQRIFLMAPSLEYLYCVFSATTDLDYSNFDLVSFAVRSSKYFSGTCLLVFKNQSIIHQQNWKKPFHPKYSLHHNACWYVIVTWPVMKLVKVPKNSRYVDSILL